MAAPDPSAAPRTTQETIDRVRDLALEYRFVGPGNSEEFTADGEFLLGVATTLEAAQAVAVALRHAADALADALFNVPGKRAGKAIAEADQALRAFGDPGLVKAGVWTMNTAPDPSAAPHIVQVLDDGAATRALKLVPHVPQLIVGLDDRGRLWSYGPAPDSAVRTWHRLPIPPLPDGEG